MCILLVLLFWEYLRIRAALAREDAAREEAHATGRHLRPSEARAQRERRERVHAKWDTNPRDDVPSDEAVDLAGGRARHGRHVANRPWDDDEFAEG